MKGPSTTYSHAMRFTVCLPPPAPTLPVMAASCGLSRAFDEPIPLPRAASSSLLEYSAAYIMKLPEGEHALEEWQTADRRLSGAAEGPRPHMHARIGRLRALNRNVVRDFDLPQRTHIGDGASWRGTDETPRSVAPPAAQSSCRPNRKTPEGGHLDCRLSAAGAYRRSGAPSSAANEGRGQRCDAGQDQRSFAPLCSAVADCAWIERTWLLALRYVHQLNWFRSSAVFPRTALAAALGGTSSRPLPFTFLVVF